MIQALGGKVFLEVKEIQTKGRFYGFKRDQVASADLFTDYLKFPNMERTEFGREKEKTIQINRGIDGWVIKPPVKKGDPDIEEQTPAQTESFLNKFKTAFDYMVRFVASTPQASVLNAGSEVVDFKRSDILEIRDAQKNLMRVFVDRETGLPLKSQTRLAGESLLDEEIYANWHRFDGVMTPLMVVRFKDGVKTMEIRTESVEYNPGFADSLFSPPARSK
jgi:outer membrane lipoprotein-sorting protein